MDRKPKLQWGREPIESCASKSSLRHGAISSACRFHTMSHFDVHIAASRQHATEVLLGLRERDLERTEGGHVDRDAWIVGIKECQTDFAEAFLSEPNHDC